MKTRGFLYRFKNLITYIFIRFLPLSVSSDEGGGGGVRFPKKRESLISIWGRPPGSPISKHADNWQFKMFESLEP